MHPIHACPLGQLHNSLKHTFAHGCSRHPEQLRTPGVCSVAGSDVTTVQPGTCTITATQAGNADFAPAPDQTQSFQAERVVRRLRPHAITFLRPADVTAGQPDRLSASASSGLTHQDLNSAARRTLAVPGSTELVALAEHQITSAMHPYVTVSVDGYDVATIQIDLSLLFDVKALVAAIRDGRLVALHSGHCDVTATLAIDQSDVTSRQARFQLPGVIPLGHGIQLLGAADYPADPRAMPKRSE
jgi:hypothetical protein